MKPLEIADKITEKFPDEVLDVREFREQVSVTLKKDRILEICRYLHDDPDLCFDYLVDICGADYEGKKEKRFEVVYHLYSIERCHAIRLKAEVTETKPEIASVTNIWAGAGWHERECYDMFGIAFSGNSDLRRILMPEDWEGYPLRKDYPVEGTEREWPGFEAVLDRANRFKKFDWQG
ncbi:MAG: NADH-quinone oxidoreductase subunit C [Nitrospiraceae bacterium]|nr:MAG: NADH-quinone oxidoreductase subunit C [Nitrospiraceae bacterium]